MSVKRVIGAILIIAGALFVIDGILAQSGSAFLYQNLGFNSLGFTSPTEYTILAEILGVFLLIIGAYSYRRK